MQLINVNSVKEHWKAHFVEEADDAVGAEEEEHADAPEEEDTDPEVVEEVFESSKFNTNHVQ